MGADRCRVQARFILAKKKERKKHIRVPFLEGRRGDGDDADDGNTLFAVFWNIIPWLGRGCGRRTGGWSSSWRVSIQGNMLCRRLSGRGAHEMRS